ncbi:DUF397 domain-containing protein [Amycolatopsis vastitatis]|uniref:DUF397 domain-containing protein n=1 Tax=Amycolatopsis vastitatis TaxID=1905142 RepID=A0A229SMC7_9PSEU|nr:DUF397 domain-containing protein [Amycolatopsis vastitatis]OXM60016.1 DUF397 domain-containing protein [Amycolatopsis vastitatis]
MTEGLIWRKSSYSGGGTTNDCVEVAFALSDEATYMRDSKDPDGGMIKLPAAGWTGLLQAVSEGTIGHTTPNG